MIPHEGNEPGLVTLSLGCASSIPAPGSSPESLIEMADAALYEAKRLGRNQVVVFEAAHATKERHAVLRRESRWAER